MLKLFLKLAECGFNVLEMIIHQLSNMTRFIKLDAAVVAVVAVVNAKQIPLHQGNLSRRCV